MDVDSNNHSVFLMYCRLVLVVNYRRKAIDDGISEYAKEMVERLGKPDNVTSVKRDHGNDRIDILFSAYPNSELSEFINAYKRANSKFQI